MPIYEYKCKNCNHKFEKLIRKIEDEKPKCPECGNDEVEKVFSTFATCGDSKGGTPSGHSCGG